MCGRVGRLAGWLSSGRLSGYRPQALAGPLVARLVICLEQGLAQEGRKEHHGLSRLFLPFCSKCTSDRQTIPSFPPSTTVLGQTKLNCSPCALTRPSLLVACSLPTWCDGQKDVQRRAGRVAPVIGGYCFRLLSWKLQDPGTMGS